MRECKPEITPATAKPAPDESARGRIVVIQDRAFIGQVVFEIGTRLAEVELIGITLEQLCAAIAHGKAGPG